MASLTKAQLLQLVVKRLLVAILLALAVIFVPAGTLDYWQAWLYLAIIFALLVAVLVYLWRNDPDLLERRMRFEEKESRQKQLAAMAYSIFLLICLVPGLDRRFGWSDVPVTVVLVSDLLVIIGSVLIFLVLRENSYAANIVAVVPGQKVISSGPYAFVRHPLYLGVLAADLAAPLALGSYWGALAMLVIIPLAVVRIRNEERVLVRDLTGYAMYRQQVHFRLVPGVW